MIKTVFAFGLGLFLVFAVLAVGNDALRLHGILSSDYETPWFDGNWVLEPVTNAVLALRGAERIYWTQNAIGTERWQVREVAWRGKQFWTILAKRPVDSAHSA